MCCHSSCNLEASPRFQFQLLTRDDTLRVSNSMLGLTLDLAVKVQGVDLGLGNGPSEFDCAP